MRFPLTSTAVCLTLSLWPAPLAADPGHGHVGERSFATGEPGNPARPARTIAVTMRETSDTKMLFEPDRIEVTRGEQVRFAITNAGTVDHEFMLDTRERNARHKAAMEKNPDMEHDDPNGKRLAPGKGAEILWRFSKPGVFEFACLIPGHYGSGMHGNLSVKSISSAEQ